MANRDHVRTLTAAASLVRLSYALGLVVAPEAMGRLRLGAATPDNGMATMTTRAFGALHANLALATLAAALRDRNLEMALRANVAADVGDAVGPLLEWRFGSLHSRLAIANAALQSSGIAAWSWGLRNLMLDRQRR